MPPSPLLYATPLVVATVLMGLLARTARRRSDEAYTGPFIAMTLAASLWAFTDALQVLTADPGTSLVLTYVAFVGAVVVPGAWLLFAIAYARNVDPTDPRVLALLAVEPALTLVLVATDPWHGLVYQSTTPVSIAGTTVVQTVPGTWYWVNLVYSYLLVGAGILLLAQVTIAGERLYRIQAGALVAGAIVPLSANVVFTFLVTEVTVVDYTALAFAATALLFGIALYRFNLLRIGPVARHVVIQELSDPVIVLNHDQRVLETNDVARRLFPALTTGDPISNALDDSPDDLADAEYTATVDDRKRTYVVRWHPFYGHRSEPAGSVLLFSDVTEVAAREQRLDVLNRILRHNLRTDANVIQGYLELASETHPDDIHITYALERVKKLVDRSEKARQVSETLHASTKTPRPVTVEPVVDEVVADIRERFPDAVIEVAVDDVSVQLPSDHLLDTVVRNLVENALVHTDETPAWVRIETGLRSDVVEVAVVDSGPGLPPAERATMAADRETQLTHSSGLGLWVVRWVAAATGTGLTFDDREPRGTIVTLAFDRTPDGVPPSPSATEPLHAEETVD